MRSLRIAGAIASGLVLAAAAACGGSKFVDGSGGARSDASLTDGPWVGTDGAADADGGANPCAVRARFCEAGACRVETFGTTADTAFGLAVRDGWVYWTTAKGVYRQPESGGVTDIQKIADTTAGGPLVLDQDGLFWLERDNGKLMTCAMPIQGPCSPKQIAPSVVGGNEMLGMGLDKERVYWTVSGGGGGAFGVPRGGGQVITYYDQGAQFIVADDKNVYIQTNCGGSFFAPKDGTGSPVELTRMCTFGAGGLAMDSRAVYFGGVQITRVPRGAGAQATLSTLEHIEGLAEYCGDLHYVQRSTDGGGYLARVPTSAFPDTGGDVSQRALEVLMRGVATGAIAVGSFGIYWTNDNDIMRLRRDP
jgi:hypothetical protein